MYSNQLNFLKFINSLIEFNDGKYYDTITNISSSNGKNPKSLIESDIKILNLEDLVLDSISGTSPAIVDGFYFRFNKYNKLSLYFVEFKGNKLNKKHLKEYFKEYICPLKSKKCGIQIFDCPISYLNQNEVRNIYEHYEDEMSAQLRIKPFESIFIGIPELFSKFTGEEGNPDTFLTKYYNCHIQVVYVKESPSGSNSHLTVKQEISAKYASYQNNGLITDYRIRNNIDFYTDDLPKIQMFPIHFLKNIINIIEDLKKNYGEISSIDNIIDEKLDDELLKEDIQMGTKQKKRLHKVIYYYYNH